MEQPTPTYQDDWLTVFTGDARDVLDALPERSIHAVVTSPPYYALRDYGAPPTVWAPTTDQGMPQCGIAPGDHSWGDTAGRLRRSPDAGNINGPAREGNAIDVSRGRYCVRCGAWLGTLGLEPTLGEYLDHLVEVCRAIRRVLRDDGTLWLNIGDSYATSAGDGAKPKDLLLVPFRFALAAQQDGWYVRRDVIWDKPNGMPESVDDRPTSAHEYIFMLTKRERYFYDAAGYRETPAPATVARARRPAVADHAYKHDGASLSKGAMRDPNRVWSDPDALERMATGRRLRSVWSIPTQGYGGAHFATFPPRLVERPILLSTSSRGVCPDCGAPWRRLTATEIVNEPEPNLGDGTRLQPLANDERGEPMGGDGNGKRYVERYETATRTLGWTPTCAHPPFAPGDLDIIASPTGNRTETSGWKVPAGWNTGPGGHDTVDGRYRSRMIEGRRGLGRERDEDEGTRPMSRFEQRCYARQLQAIRDAAPERWAEMTAEAGGETTIAHYARTDRSGARVIPARLLEHWLARGDIIRAATPAIAAKPPVPATILDPFAGSGTTGLVAQRYSRRAILIDVQPDYTPQQMQRNRASVLGLLDGDEPAESAVEAMPQPLWEAELVEVAITEDTSAGRIVSVER